MTTLDRARPVYSLDASPNVGAPTLLLLGLPSFLSSNWKAQLIFSFLGVSGRLSPSPGCP